MLGFAPAVRLIHDAAPILTARGPPTRPLAEVLQAAVDLLRGAAAADEFVALDAPLPASPRAITTSSALNSSSDALAAGRALEAQAACGAGAGACPAAGPPASAALERDFLASLLGACVLAEMAREYERAPPRAADAADRLHAEARTAAAWAHPAAAARLAERLAALGVRGRARAAADLRFGLYSGAALLGGAVRQAGGAPPAHAERAWMLEQAVAANSAALSTGAELALELLPSSPARALATALAALERAGPDGSGTAAPRLLMFAASAISLGGRAPAWTAGEVRPLLERAARLLAGCEAWVFRPAWEAVAKDLAEHRRVMLGRGLGDDVALAALDLSRLRDALRAARELRRRAERSPEAMWILR
jgi:hypothetical protein